MREAEHSLEIRETPFRYFIYNQNVLTEMESQ